MRIFLQIGFLFFICLQNFRYRFRLINAEFLNCPIEVSVDNHTLYVVSSDGRDIEPTQGTISPLRSTISSQNHLSKVSFFYTHYITIAAESLVSYAGERFDFIIEMDQPVDNYWMRFRGLMDCDERFLSAYQIAILRYEGAPEEEPSVEVSYDRARNDSYGPVRIY